MSANSLNSSLSAIADEELANLFAWLDDHFPLTVAVSGGVDSMALLLLLARWQGVAQAGGKAAQSTMKRHQIAIVSVDHGLRAQAAAEAELVKVQARALGFYHETLVWRGEKPSSGVQAAARAARYHLLARFHRSYWSAGGDTPLGALVTAHHQDDAAETLLMRLARGSGIDGLAGMACKTAREGVPLLRPLLAIPKSRLQAVVDGAGVAFVQDPSNSNRNFERVRLRAALAGLRAVGLENDKLALSARRLHEAREALIYAVGQLAQACRLDHHAGAFASIDIQPFRVAPRALQVRLLQRLIALHGGQEGPARLAKIEVLADRLRETETASLTLGGCHIWLSLAKDDGQTDKLIVRREVGRASQPLPEIILRPGQRAVWDRRFTVSLCREARDPVTVKALPTSLFKELLARIGTVEASRFSAARALPSFWRGKDLFAVPHLAWVDPLWQASGGPQNKPVEANFIDQLQTEQLSDENYCRN